MSNIPLYITCYFIKSTKTTQWHGDCCYPQITDEETKVQKVTCLNYTTSKWQSQDSNPGSLPSESKSWKAFFKKLHGCFILWALSYLKRSSLAFIHEWWFDWIKNSSSLLFSAVDGSLLFPGIRKRWREVQGPLEFISLLLFLLDIWKMLYLWHWINLSLYDSILFLLYQFCLLYTMIFQIADSSPHSLQENFPVVCFSIFFCFTCWVLNKSIKDLYNELSLNSLTLSNFFLCISCNYFRSSHVINMIF